MFPCDIFEDKKWGKKKDPVNNLYSNDHLMCILIQTDNRSQNSLEIFFL